MRTNRSRLITIAIPTLALLAIGGAVRRNQTARRHRHDRRDGWGRGSDALALHRRHRRYRQRNPPASQLVVAYPTLENTADAGQPDNSLRANGNVYIDAGEDLTGDAIVASLTLQNTLDVDGGGMAGRTEGSNVNAEFSGEITVSICNTGAPAEATGPTNCVPPDVQNGTSFVVSPRLSDGAPTTDAYRKRFYVIVLRD